MFGLLKKKLLGKSHLTKVCERVTPRLIDSIASADAATIRSEFSFGSISGSASADDRAWSSWMQGGDHPKRSLLLSTILFMAAAHFLNKSSETNEIYSASGSANPIKSMTPDVVLTEVLIFFWYHFYIFMRPAIKNGELIGADEKALTNAGITISHVVQETTRCSIAETFPSRVKEYDERDTHENPVEVFVSVLLRSVGKNAVNEPDRQLNPFGDGMMRTAVTMSVMLYMTAMLPVYFDSYKDVVRNYPMD